MDKLLSSVLFKETVFA